MVKLRLFRTGAKGKPSYRIVAIDSREKRQGRPLEVLGTYDPQHPDAVVLQEDAISRWLERGARPSDSVASLLRRARRNAGVTAPSA